MPVDALIAQAEGLATCTRDLRGLARSLADDDILAQALTRCAQERRGGAFQRLLLAGMEAGRSFPAQVLTLGASLLPDMRALATAITRCSGDAAAAMVAAVRDGRLGDWDAYAIYQAVWWAQQQEPPAPLGPVLHEARAIARRPLGPDAQLVLSAVHQLTSDAQLKVVLRNEGHLQGDKEAAACVRDLAAWFSAPPLLDLPARPPPAQPATAPQKSAKVGRNEACPCGSGKKYKRCCLGKPVDAAPQQLDEEALLGLTGWQLCRLDTDQVPEALRELWATQLLQAAEYERAAQVLVALGRQGREQLFRDALRWATAVERREAVVMLASVTPQEDIMESTQMFLLRGDPAAQLAFIEAQALETTSDPNPVMGYALLDGGLPGLALLALRGALGTAESDELGGLLQTLLQIRDRAGLGPVDLVEERVLPWVLAGRPLEDSGLGAALDEKTVEAERLRDELARVHTRWKAERDASSQAQAPAEPAPAPPTADPEVLRQLRTKVASLVDELKVRTAERAELRGDVARLEEALAEALAATPAPSAPAAPAEPADEGPSGPHPVRVPVVPAGVAATLAGLPEPVQRQAMELLGRLAAGRSDAFRGSRPLRGRSWLWRQKVGRSYRMFFTLADDRLEVVDVIHRQDLEKRIRELS